MTLARFPLRTWPRVFHVASGLLGDGLPQQARHHVQRHIDPCRDAGTRDDASVIDDAPSGFDGRPRRDLAQQVQRPVMRRGFQAVEQVGLGQQCRPVQTDKVNSLAAVRWPSQAKSVELCISRLEPCPPGTTSNSAGGASASV